MNIYQAAFLLEQLKSSPLCLIPLYQTLGIKIVSIGKAKATELRLNISERNGLKHGGEFNHYEY